MKSTYSIKKILFFIIQH